MQLEGIINNKSPGFCNRGNCEIDPNLHISYKKIDDDLDGLSKQEVLDILVKNFPREIFKDVSADYVYKALLEREQIATTAVAENVSIPHAALEINHFYCPITVLSSGVDFQSLDKGTTDLFLPLLYPKDSPEKVKWHYLMLLSGYMRNAPLTHKLRQSQTLDCAFRVLSRQEISVEPLDNTFFLYRLPNL
jgi:mannitol/fructose-specific phosphotransferase system IIA component (Ntr-type)